MGEPKQLLTFNGSTLLQHAIASAIQLGKGPVVVVLGAHEEKIRVQLNKEDILVVQNPVWREGMGSSVRAGLRALIEAHPETDSAIFLPCDQPLLTAATLRGLIETHQSTGMPIVASDYNGALGSPALFLHAHFSTRSLSRPWSALPERGQIITNHRSSAIGVPFPAAQRISTRPPTMRAYVQLSENSHYQIPYENHSIVFDVFVHCDCARGYSQRHDDRRLRRRFAPRAS